MLGVSREADQKAIKEVFRQLALKYHPDRNKEPGAEDRFKEIAEAYAVLSDPKKRAEYDAGGFAGVTGVSPEDLFASINFDDLFGGLGFDFGGNTIFERFFGRRRSAGPPRGENIEVDVVIPLARVASGGPEQVRFTRTVSCPDCHGSGAKAGTSARPCPACQGSGRKTTSQQREGVFIQHAVLCPDCHGRGRLIDIPCSRCGGRGLAAIEEALDVTIPAGIEEGMVLRIPGHGLPGPKEGGLPGDLYLRVTSAADPRFARDGADLWHTATLDVTDAVLGTTLTIPTLVKHAAVVVPAGTQPDAVLRLKGKGLPLFGGRGHGDLFVRIAVMLPKQVSQEERVLYERLRSLRRGRHDEQS